ncbi:MAG: hypothetical protein GY874_08595 [Desulfobacteraceae bacterium]|nr:hypothetical protein [Desulfobacteraceae bacterium]
MFTETASGVISTHEKAPSGLIKPSDKIDLQAGLQISNPAKGRWQMFVLIWEGV